MKKQIVHISVHQTSKVIAAMHAVLFAVLFILPSVLGYWYHGQIVFGLLLLTLIPLFLWILLYIGYVVACWFYNLVVPFTGGIEVEVVDESEQPNPFVKPPTFLQEEETISSKIEDKDPL